MTTQEVKLKIKKAGGSWKVFCEWMRGQTVGLYEDGSTNWYDYDVNRFIKYQCDPKKEPFVDFD